MSTSLTIQFISWYWMKAPARILALGRDFLRWGWQYFSIGYLAPRLFSPWHRDLSGYGRGFDLKRILRVLGWNLISRVLGAVMRVFVMAAGLVVEVGLVVLTVAAMVWWFILPVLSVLFIIFGAINLVS